ncbi:MAG: septum formation protein Maf [Gemmataceae bacterium]|nr:septum formation protein Maf [Gemmataceae bacterium]
MEIKNPIILASASPARAELLRRILADFEIVPSNAKEPEEGFSHPRDLVSLASWLKAREVANRVTQGLIIAADTIGWLNGSPLLKPKSRQDAFAMLETMAGRRHELWTGIVLWKQPNGLQLCWQEQSIVEFRALSAGDIEEYLATREWKNHSGSYAIQEKNDPYVRLVQGSLTNVIGLPLESLRQNLELLDIPLTNDISGKKY